MHRGASFAGDAQFVSTRLCKRMSFADAKFEEAANFEKIGWPEEPIYWHEAFDRAIFKGLASFDGSGCRSFAAFAGATFLGGLKFDAVPEGEATERFEQEMRGAMALARDAAPVEKPETVDEAKPVEQPALEQKDRLNDRLRQLESGCRVLELEMTKQLDRTREQLFYRFGLIARRKQPDTALPEKTFSLMYWIASDYGASLLRPIIAILASVLLFGLLYYGWASLSAQAAQAQGAQAAQAQGAQAAQAQGAQAAQAQGAQAAQAQGAQTRSKVPNLWEALDFSWSNVFHPLSALSADAVRPSALTDALFADAATGFSVRVVATLQSLLALIFAFLFGLAVRRRFQMG